MATAASMFDKGKPNVISPTAPYVKHILHVLCVPSVTSQGSVVPTTQGRDKPRTGRDIARVTFDLYKISPRDVFGSLSVKATFQGLYSVSADFQCLGPKKILR